MLARFRDQVNVVDELSKQFIDSSFKKLRSAEGAFELLQNIQHLKTREEIHQQLLLKFNDILAQCGKEIEAIDGLFQSKR
jgi:dynein heavy chain